MTMANLTLEQAIDEMNRISRVTGYSEYRMRQIITRLYNQRKINEGVREELIKINNSGSFGRCLLAVIRSEDTERNPLTFIRTYDMYGNETMYTPTELIDSIQYKPLLQRNVRNYQRNRDGSLDVFIL